MKKIFFIFTAVLMLFGAVFLAGCKSEEDIGGEAGYIISSLESQVKCNNDNVGKTLCGPYNQYIWECKKITSTRLCTTTKPCYIWVNTNKKCVFTPCVKAGLRAGKCCEGLVLQNGVCTVPKCKDTDGADYYTKGNVTAYDKQAGKYVTATDNCEYDTVNEYICDGSYGKETEFKCPNGCKDGACVAGPEKVSLKLNYGDEIKDKWGGGLTSNDFPVLLKGGDLVYKAKTGTGNTPYTQFLQFERTVPDNDGSVLGTGQLIFAANDDGEKIAADYLAFDDDSIDYMYIYQLSFETPVPCSNALAGASINMLRNTFTITSIESTIASACSKIILAGANVEYQLIDGMEVYKNGVKISGSRINLAAATTPGEINGFTITYTPQDEEYVPEGTSIVDPIFGSFKIQLNGLSKNQEQIDLEVSSDGLSAKFINLVGADGNNIPVSFSVDNGMIKSEPAGTNRVYVTKYGATVGLNDDGVNPFQIYILEEDTANNGLQAKIGLSYDAVSNTLKIMEPLIIEAKSGQQWNKVGIRASTTNKYLKYYVTEWGTLINYDSSSMKKLTVWYPDEQVFGTVDITNS